MPWREFEVLTGGGDGHVELHRPLGTVGCRDDFARGGVQREGGFAVAVLDCIDRGRGGEVDDFAVAGSPVFVADLEFSCAGGCG